jgi:CheY-like chemotaxis protein
MSTPPTILLVDDDGFVAETTTMMLDSEYRVQHVTGGEAALSALAEARPDLVLLDVDMPGMSGYDVCKALREDAAICDVPVIFLSGMTSEEERLAGYEAGGDDYLTKPATAEELRSKIKHELTRYAERKRLKHDLSSAFSTAMTAMSSAAEVGAILQFLRASFICPDYAALCNEVLNTLVAFGLEGSVQIRGQQKTVSQGTNGVSSPLEESVLTNMSKFGRIFEFSSRTVCSYEHITIIVKDANHDDPDRHGRMRDNLAMLAEGADSRVIALDNQATVARQHEHLVQLTASAHKALHGINHRHRDQGVKSNQLFEALQKRFERSLLTLGITQSQEDELAEILQDAVRQAQSLHVEGQQLSLHVAKILKQLENAIA